MVKCFQTFYEGEDASAVHNSSEPCSPVPFWEVAALVHNTVLKCGDVALNAVSRKKEVFHAHSSSIRGRHSGALDAGGRADRRRTTYMPAESAAAGSAGAGQTWRNGLAA